MNYIPGLIIFTEKVIKSKGIPEVQKPMVEVCNFDPKFYEFTIHFRVCLIIFLVSNQ